MVEPEFIHGVQSLKPKHRGCVATIGSFDGVHRGHQVLLDQVVKMAKQCGLPSLVMVFEPQPHEYFSRQTAPPRLMRLREKVEALFEQGIDRVLCLKFNQQLRTLSAEDYVRRVLVEGVGVKHLIIGDDFKFGCDRSGDFAMLKEQGAIHGFTVCDTPTQQEDFARISSTRIRGLLERDAFEEAERLLGKPFTVSGRVIYGRQLGRTLGFPTANIGLGRYRSPVSGVYAVGVKLVGVDGSQVEHPGVANVGVRPTVDGGVKPLLEVHLLDARQDLYGMFLRVTFKRKIREEQRFSSLDDLQAQIKKDALQAKELLCG